MTNFDIGERILLLTGMAVTRQDGLQIVVDSVPEVRLYQVTIWDDNGNGAVEFRFKPGVIKDSRPIYAYSMPINGRIMLRDTILVMIVALRKYIAGRQIE